MCVISAVFPNWRSSIGLSRPEKLNQPLTRLNFSLTPCQSYYRRHHRRLRVLSPNACARVNDAPCSSRPARRDFLRMYSLHNETAQTPHTKRPRKAVWQCVFAALTPLSPSRLAGEGLGAGANKHAPPHPALCASAPTTKAVTPAHDSPPLPEYTLTHLAPRNLHKHILEVKRFLAEGGDAVAVAHKRS